MLKCLSLTFLAVAANVFHSEGKLVEQVKQRIVGGEIASIDTLPYQVQLLLHGKQICGGSIISESWIISAAHCIVAPASDLSIITGSDKISSGGQHYAIKRTIVHPAYNDDTSDNDIALIELKESIKFDANEEPIELATTVPLAGDIITVSGFGRQSEKDSAPSTFLKMTTIPVVDFEECEKKYIRDPITESVFCAGEGPTDACEGDSGGPAVIDGMLVGIVSTGMKCGDSYYPGLYTRVANYRKWISDSMADQSPTRPINNESSQQPPKKFQLKTLLGKLASKLFG